MRSGRGEVLAPFVGKVDGTRTSPANNMQKTHIIGSLYNAHYTQSCTSHLHFSQWFGIAHLQVMQVEEALLSVDTLPQVLLEGP